MKSSLKLFEEIVYIKTDEKRNMGSLGEVSYSIIKLKKIYFTIMWRGLVRS